MFLLQVIIVGPAILLIRSRTRHLPKPPRAEEIDYSVLRKPIFASLSICNFLQGLVFYLPSIFIPCKSYILHTLHHKLKLDSLRSRYVALTNPAIYPASLDQSLSDHWLTEHRPRFRLRRCARLAIRF